MGTLLGDPEVWDDHRPRPRVAVRAAVGPAPDRSLTVLDNGVVESFGKSGARPRRLTPASFTAGFAGRAGGKQVLACGGLVDEPTAELDEGNFARVVGLLRDAADRRTAVVVATHEPDVVDLCDRVVHLTDGRPTTTAPDPVA